MVESQLIPVLMCESPDLIITGLHCWAIKLKVVIKRSEVESLLPCSLTVLHDNVPVCCPAENKIVISDVFDSN